MRGSRDIDLQKYRCPDRHGPPFMHRPLFMQVCMTCDMVMRDDDSHTAAVQNLCLSHLGRVAPGIVEVRSQFPTRCITTCWRTLHPELGIRECFLARQLEQLAVQGVSSRRGTLMNKRCSGVVRPGHGPCEGL
jgi:hypothetical protein